MGVCRVGFLNFCFYSIISFSLIRYLLSLIIINLYIYIKPKLLVAPQFSMSTQHRERVSRFSKETHRES